MDRYSIPFGHAHSDLFLPRKGGEQDSVPSLVFRILLLYGPVLETVALSLFLSCSWYTQVCWHVLFNKYVCMYVCYDKFWGHYGLFVFWVVLPTGSSVQLE